MSAYRFHSSPADSWSQPRPHRDASLRLMTHGPIRPMDEERSGLLTRLFRLN
jgi:hypothetical protein